MGNGGVTFQEVRTHLGVETQRQWSKNAITRTTPALLGLYSLVCLWAQQALESNRMSYAVARYEKTNFTFSDAIAVIRCEIFLSHSPPDRECDKKPISLTQTTAIRALLPRIMYKVELSNLLVIRPILATSTQAIDLSRRS